MPTKPKSVKRPWIKQIDYNKLPGQGRIITNNFYQSKQWKRMKKLFKAGISTHLGPNPHPNAICIECKRMGIVTATYAIDHIKKVNPSNPYDTINGLYGEPLEWENLQPLCESCHAKKSAKEK